MRLLNVETISLEEFVDDEPRYAILSHTWEDDEVTFQDFTSLSEEQRCKKKGFAKILKTCELARNGGIHYAWVDTCCIDKTSSAELTEAINSMFRWYRNSAVCYTWLADWTVSESGQENSSGLTGCRWFTRGWTLQELIAPSIVEFYDQGWNLRGNKSSLQETLADITQIATSVLEAPDVLPTLSIARRMSWAASRKTTRVEDMAYCLLGLFDVSMPMVYGEGKRAFLRLQEEIAKESNDVSIFAWRNEDTTQQYHGVFADSPADFRGSGSVRLLSNSMFMPEFMMTNKGIRLNTNLRYGSQGAYLLKLQCSETAADGTARHFGIWLKQHGGAVYSRIRANEFGVESPDDLVQMHLMFLAKHIGPAQSRELGHSHSNAFYIRKGLNQKDQVDDPDFPFGVSMWSPQDQWDSQRRMFLNNGAASFAASGIFTWRQSVLPADDMHIGHTFLLILGKKAEEDNPWISMASPMDQGSMFSLINDPEKVLAASRKSGESRMVLVRDVWQNVTMAVYIAVEKTKIDGQDVYCLDLTYGDAPEISKINNKEIPEATRLATRKALKESQPRQQNG